MTINGKILIKILANQIQEHIKMVIYLNQVDLIPAMQGWFNAQKSINIMHCIDKLKEKIILDAVKAFDKIQHVFWLKVLEILESQDQYLNIIKAIYHKLTANNKLNGEILETMPLKSRTMTFLSLSVQYST